MKGKEPGNKGKISVYNLEGKHYYIDKEDKEKLNLYTLEELRNLGINITTGSKDRNKGKTGFYDINGKRKFRYEQEQGLYTAKEAKTLGII